VALLFGIELIWNFHFPYWATSIIDFWHRWHISLSRWLRDYLYIPLGGSRTSTLNTTRNLMVTMLLGGLWHGANWTFVIWGGLHGSALVLNHWLAPGAPSGRFQKALGWAITMLVVFVGWFIFRVASMQQAFAMVSALGNLTWFPAHTDLALTLASSTAAVAAIEFAQLRSADHCFVLKWHEWPRAALYAGIVGYLILVRQHAETKFIYFQF
jgi:D-alanyl-lipoteichoic acid acyltransferase DltB (MBOAT superfamily)